jgi:hypothetical protein
MKRAAINRTYIPKFCGNRDLPEEEQVMVDVDLATMKEQDKFSCLKYGKNGSVIQEKKEYLALRKKVKKIDNYYDEDGNPIDTADKLIADMETGAGESIKLCIELYNLIMGYSADEDESEDTEDFTEGES